MIDKWGVLVSSVLDLVHNPNIESARCEFLAVSISCLRLLLTLKIWPEYKTNRRWICSSKARSACCVCQKYTRCADPLLLERPLTWLSLRLALNGPLSLVYLAYISLLSLAYLVNINDF